MNSSMLSNSCCLAMPQPLAITVRAEANGPPLAREPVGGADLSYAVAEAWRDQCLRQGHPELALAEVPMTLMPLFPEGSIGPRCNGFALDVELPDGQWRRQEFSLSSLKPVARRAADSLADSGILGSNARCYYEVTVDDSVPKAASGQRQTVPFRVSIKHQPPTFLRISLRPLLLQSRAVDLEDDAVFPVFFTAKALEKADACARRGAQSVPPVESGGMLVGSLAFCQVTNEFFPIVTDVLEATEAEHTTFSLSFGQSWTRIQAIMKATQAAYPERCMRLLGQCHGHNFLPNDGNRCEECDKRPVCALTSVFASPQDEMWMGSVFAHQPWALCHIFGLTARKEPVHQLYSLKDGCWQPRGYFVLPDFEWKQNAEPMSASEPSTRNKK